MIQISIWDSVRGTGHSVQEILSSIPDKERDALQLFYRRRAKESVLFLAREVLNYSWIEYDLQYHQELERQAMHLGESLTLCPRSFIKSTVVTISGVVWYMLKFPEHCILLVSNNKDNCKKFLRGVAEHFSSNPVMQWVYPEYCPVSSKESPTKEQFTLPNRKSIGRREATVEIAGIDSSMAGRHYEKIVCDDIVHEINVPPKGSEEVMAVTFEQFCNLDNLLKTGVQDDVIPHRTVVGTRWHDGDTYGCILDPDEEMRDIFEVLIAEPYGNMWRNCDNRTGESWEGGQKVRSREEGVLWPSRYPEPQLKVLRKKRREYGWACLMAQDPLPPDSAHSFSKEWFHKFDLKEYLDNPEWFTTAITVDPAFNEGSQRSDRTAIAVTAVHYDGGIYLLAIDAGKYTPNQIADKVFALCYAWPNTEWIGVECDSGGRAIYNVIRDRKREEGLDVPLKDLWTEGQKKDARVARLSARAERAGIFYHSRIREEHVQEIVRYPVSRWRDIPDVIAYRAIALSRPSAPVKKKKTIREVQIKPVTGADILERLNGRGAGGLRRLG